MAKTQRKYDMKYKIQAVKLAKELGGADRIKSRKKKSAASRRKSAKGRK